MDVIVIAGVLGLLGRLADDQQVRQQTIEHRQFLC